MLSLPADIAVPPFSSILLFPNSPISLDKKGFDTLRSLLSGCPYFDVHCTPRPACPYLFNTDLYLGLHIYLEFNTLGPTLDYLGFIDCYYHASFPRLGEMNLNQLMYIWLNPWSVYTRFKNANPRFFSATLYILCISFFHNLHLFKKKKEKCSK